MSAKLTFFVLLIKVHWAVIYKHKDQFRWKPSNNLCSIESLNLFLFILIKDNLATFIICWPDALVDMILIMFTLGIDYIAGSGKEVVLIFCPLSISVLCKNKIRNVFARYNWSRILNVINGRHISCVLAEIGCIVPGLWDSEVNGKCQASSNDTWRKEKLWQLPKLLGKWLWNYTYDLFVIWNKK